MAYFRCTTGGSGKGNTLVVTCADDLAGATITCTNGTKTYTKTCPSTSPYEVTFYGLEAGTWTVSATVSGNTYTTTVVVVDCVALLGGFNWRTWVDTAQFLDSSDYDSLDEVLADEEAVRELCLEHACVDYLARVASATADVETIIENDLFAKWVNNSDYSLDILGANTAIKALMDTADKYFYGEWCLMPQVPTMTSNTAPSGEVIYNNLRHGTPNEAYKIFVPSNATNITNYTETQDPTSYIGYDFGKSVRVSGLYFKQTYVNEFGIKSFTIKGSNDKSTWESIVTITRNENAQVYRTEFVNDKSFRYYAFFANTVDSTKQYYGLLELQFYAYAPKGNVPIMTANNAPYGTASNQNSQSGYEAYKAFDGNDTTYAVGSSTAGTGSGPYIAYKSSNPINVRRIYHKYTSASGTETITVKYSDDGSIWTGTNIQYTIGANEGKYVDVPDCGYHLYWGCFKVSSTASSKMYAIALQFYGRELSVSVPKMDTNTTPYGEASASSIISGYEAYKAFDNESGTRWNNDGVNLPSKLIYKFTSPTCVKGFKLTPAFYDNLMVKEFEILGSNDGVSWSDPLYSETLSNATQTITRQFANDTEYLYYAINVKSTYHASGTSVSIIELQFYGLDYSEKEFEEGTTKKWLYDHGVELEPITVGTQCVKENTQIVCNGLNSVTSDVTMAYTTAKVDLSSFSMMRGIIGTKNKLSNDRYGIIYVLSGDTIIFNTDYWTANEQYASIPNPNTTIHLGVSSINESKYIGFGCGADSNRQFSVAEWWLE